MEAETWLILSIYGLLLLFILKMYVCSTVTEKCVIMMKHLGSIDSSVHSV